MEATELRIGNHVEKSLKSGNGRKVFDKIRISDINHIYEKDGSFNYEPIPLTEEILLKCGFKILKHEFDSTFYSINILDTVVYLRPSYLSGFYWGFMLDKLEAEINDCKRIEHVHQLQNLYFALTGKELEINL